MIIATVLSEEDSSGREAIRIVAQAAKQLNASVVSFVAKDPVSEIAQAIDDSGAQFVVTQYFGMFGSWTPALVTEMLSRGIQPIVHEGCGSDRLRPRTNDSWGTGEDKVVIQEVSLCCNNKAIDLLVKWFTEGVPAYLPQKTLDEIRAEHEALLNKAFARWEREQQFLKKVAARRSAPA